MSHARTNSLPTPRTRPRIFAMLTIEDLGRRTNVSIRIGRPEGPAALIRPRIGVHRVLLRSFADDFERDGRIAARRVRVGANLLVRFAHEPLELRLLDAPLFDLHAHGDAEAAAFAWASRDRTGDFGPGCIALVLLRDVVERAAEARGITGREEVLGRRRVGPAGPAHLLRHRQIRLDDAVARFGMAVAAPDGGRGRGVERLNGVHSSPFPSQELAMAFQAAWEM